MSLTLVRAFHAAKTLLMPAAALALAAALPAMAQYPGRVTEKPKDTPQLRAVAVLEWTGEAGKPKTCRIVPVSIYDGERLNDAGIYLARPQPLAVSSEVEYQLKENGRTIGIFDIKNAGQEQGSWVGYGEWKPLSKPQAEVVKSPVVDDDANDDKPVLHRKHHDDAAKPSGDSKTSNSPDASEDDGRPRLHKPKDETQGANSKPDDKAGIDGPALVDDERPVLKKPKDKSAQSAQTDPAPQFTDPDRPRLIRGKSNADSINVLPSLMGLPPDMQQAIAVSDAQNKPDHPWTFHWANPDDEQRMRAELEDVAREALGLNPPPAPPAATKAKTRRAAATRTHTPPPPPLQEPVPLRDENFRVFELSYGAGATLVLTADTGGPLAEQKFVTLIAQPDLYGKLQVLLKNVTDGKHLDQTPHMRLIDAVDAMADNRGELLFELRGNTARQFALYRVLRGRADQLFVSGGGPYGSLEAQ